MFIMALEEPFTTEAGINTLFIVLRFVLRVRQHHFHAVITAAVRRITVWLLYLSKPIRQTNDSSLIGLGKRMPRADKMETTI